MSARDFVWPKREDWLAPATPTALPPPPATGANRRAALLGSLAGTLAGMVVKTAAAARHPDAELIALCQRYMALTSQIQTAFKAMPEHYTREQEVAYDAEHVDPLEAVQDELFREIKAIRAKTLDGLLIRIQMTVKEFPYLLTDEAYGAEALVQSILLDGMALAGGQA